MRGFQLLVCFLLLTPKLSAQQDKIGSGRAIQMDGLDDYIDLGNIYDDIQFPITISAWVFVDPSVSNWAPVFISQDNAAIYNGFWFLVQPTAISIGYGDGLGQNDPPYRRSKTVSFANVSGRWVHIAGIIRGAVDMDIYVNGINVGGSYSGSSNSPMSALPTDVAKIGYWYSNFQTFYFRGKLDEIRIWNKSLSQNEIRKGMCQGISENDPDLVGYWDFNETSGNVVYDKSPKGYNGTFRGNPQRVFSGAPIGEISKYDYKSNWAGVTVDLADGDHKMTVSNIDGNPEGIHLYKVSTEPSQKGGLSGMNNKPYFGVFLASLDNDNMFDVAYSFQGSPSCKAYTRADNSIASWSSADLPVQDKVQRAEYINIQGVPIGEIDLGQDKVYCNSTGVTLSTNVSDPLVSLLWNTGQTSSSIVVTTSGNYWVRATGTCGTAFDEVRLDFVEPPAPFSFGDDLEMCPFIPLTLRPYSNSNGYEFTWQDGSTEDYFTVIDYGTYSVKVKNVCGEIEKTVSYSAKISDLGLLPNVITPNGDNFNEFFEAANDQSGPITLLITNRWGKRVFFSENYQNDWNGADLSSGIYFYRITGGCIRESKGTISILR